MLSLHRNGAFIRLSNPLSRHAILHQKRKSISSSIPTHAHDSSQELVDWISKSGNINGVKIQKWNGADGGSGFGLQASQKINAGDAIITLPESLHLSYNATDTDPRLLSLIDQVPKELWGAKLALQLLNHRLQGNTSPFASYISNLPIGFPGLPIFFPPEAIKALSYPPVTSQITKRCRWLLQFANDVISPLKGTPETDPFNGATLDANALGWALAAVTSRAFRTRGMDQPAAMLPLIDMANHSFEPNATIMKTPPSTTTMSSGSSHADRIRNGENSLSMVALRDIDPGEPILISYGRLSNDFLLLDYGFIIPDNPYDTVQLKFDRSLIEAAKAIAQVGSSIDPDIEELSPLPSWQTRALSSIGLHGQDANLEVNILQSNNTKSLQNIDTSTEMGSTKMDSTEMDSTEMGSTCTIDPRLLAGTRILCAANRSQLQDKAGINDLGIWNTPLSLKHEIATLHTLTGVCCIALSHFGGTLEDDLTLLKSGIDPETGGALGDHLQLAIRFRVEKKRLLMNALHVLSVRIKELSAVISNESGDGSKKKKEKKDKEVKKGKGFGN